MAFFKIRLKLFARRHDVGHVDFVECGQHRGRVLRLFETFSDPLAQTGHLHAFLARVFCTGRGRRCRFCSGRGRRGRRGHCRADAVFHKHQDIAFGQASVFAGATDLAGIEIVFIDQLANGRRQLVLVIVV